jgi:Flp pilus assembly protein TadD
VDEHRDIYRQPDQDRGPDQLPAYEVTPDQLRAAARRRVILFSLLFVALAGTAALFAWNADKKISDDKLKDLLNAAPRPTNTAQRVALAPMSTVPALEDFSYPSFSNSEPASLDLSPQRMADAMAQVRKASAFLAIRDWDQAEQHARAALAIWPDMAISLRMLGVVYTQRGQFDEAITVLERALVKDPFSAEAFNTLGTAYMQKRVFDKAEELLHTSLSIRPGYAIAQANLGLLYVLQQKYEQAVEQFEAAGPNLPEVAAIPNNLGVCFIRLGRYEEARTCLETLLQREPRRAAPYFNVAISYVLQKDLTNAMSWVRQGSAVCTPADVQRFLADRDFDDLRRTAECQTFLRDIFPDIPPAPPAT